MKKEKLRLIVKPNGFNVEDINEDKTMEKKYRITKGRKKWIIYTKDTPKEIKEVLLDGCKLEEIKNEKK
jgi:hypothetical protein